MRSHARAACSLFGGFVLAVDRALYFLLPQLAGLQDTWHRIEDGSPCWMLLALVFTLGDVRRLRRAVPRHLRARPARGRSAGARATRSRWPAWRRRGCSPPAAPAALVLTAWALRRAGMRARARSPTRTLAFLVLHLRRLHGGADRLRARPAARASSRARRRSALTVVPAIIGADRDRRLGAALALVPTDLERRLERLAPRRPRARRPARRSGSRTRPPSASAGMRDALAHVRHPRPRAARRGRCSGRSRSRVLWACVPRVRRRAAVGRARQAFFVGMLGNLLPMPGGVGGVDGGMIGALVGVRRRRRPGRGGGARLPRVRVLAAADPGRHRLLPAAQDASSGGDTTRCRRPRPRRYTL